MPALFGHEVLVDFTRFRLGTLWKGDLKIAPEQTDITLDDWTGWPQRRRGVEKIVQEQRRTAGSNSFAGE